VEQPQLKALTDRTLLSVVSVSMPQFPPFRRLLLVALLAVLALATTMHLRIPFQGAKRLWPRNEKNDGGMLVAYSVEWLGDVMRHTETQGARRSIISHYDEAGRLKEMLERLACTTAATHRITRYEFDANGNVLKKTPHSASVTSIHAATGPSYCPPQTGDSSLIERRSSFECGFS
jgi:YD repeat-containing protein